jgi:peptide/nickel transport system permease protein
VVFGGLVLAALAVVAFLAPQIAPADPMQQNLRARLTSPQGLGKPFPLGSDSLGRDIMSRIVYGGRVSLTVSLATVLLAGTIGTSLGLVAGFRRGMVDAILCRIADMQLSIPVVMLAIVLMSVLGSSLTNIILVMTVSSWVLYFRTMRGLVLRLAQSAMVESALAIGVSTRRIYTHYLLANTVSPLIILGSQQVAYLILLESTLSFLGIGLPPSIPSWGTMVAQGRNYLEAAWWLVTILGLCISTTALAAIFFGDGMRDLLDPRRT